MRIIDEVFAKLKNFKLEISAIDKKLEDELLDALGWSEKSASKRKSFLSREYLKQKDIKALEEYIAKTLGELGIKLVTGADKYLDAKNARAGFNYITGELVFRKKFAFYEAFHEQFILPANSTEIVAFHEMAHVKHFEQLGEAYHELNVLQKETYVWKEILINRGKWTEKELKESLRYINVKRKESGLNPLKIE